MMANTKDEPDIDITAWADSSVKTADRIKSLRAFLEADLDVDETGSSPGTTLTNLGQVSYLSLPDGWTEGERREGLGYYREYNPAGSQETKLILAFRGVPLSAELGSKFHELLEVLPHKLDQKKIETLKGVFDVLGGPEEFDLQSVVTEEIGDKVVLEVTGRYKTRDAQTFAIFIDADDSGRFLQEIRFEAPSAQYGQYAKSIKSSLESISWK